MISLIKDKVDDLINFKFDPHTIKSNISDYINILCWNKINELSTDTVEVNQLIFTRSIEDIEIKNGNEIYKIDIRTNDVNKGFTIPNLISIDKVRKYLSNVFNHILYIFVDYKIDDNITTITDILVQPIESLDWSYLSIQNLGKGQLQIKSTTTNLTFNNNVTRKEWYDRLIREGKEYYDRLILKVTEYKIDWEKNYE